VVIVFDRIRENVPIMRKSTYREVVNTSVHETLTRSIITSLMTLIPLLVLFFFGGDTLKDFAFALLVGILSGGLSSIAIAAPLAALWKEREPEMKRKAVKAERRAAAIASDSDVVDLDTLARAEAALDAEIRIEDGREPEEPEEPEYEEQELLELRAGEIAPDDETEPEGDAEPEEVPEELVADTEPDAEPTAVPDAGEPGNGAAADAEPAPRARANPNRPRRHRDVQRRRKR
jgi:SecD/SecF fusion protein